jgi:hypothetical protein
MKMPSAAPPRGMPSRRETQMLRTRGRGARLERAFHRSGPGTAGAVTRSSKRGLAPRERRRRGDSVQGGPRTPTLFRDFFRVLRGGEKRFRASSADRLTTGGTRHGTLWPETGRVVGSAPNRAVVSDARQRPATVGRRRWEKRERTPLRHSDLKHRNNAERIDVVCGVGRFVAPAKRAHALNRNFAA